MKRNMLTVIIIVLILINVVLSSSMFFVMMPALTKMNKLMTDVATIIDLEVEPPEEQEALSYDDIEIYTIEKKLTLNLKDSGHYVAMDSVSISLNKTAEDYQTVYDSLGKNQDFLTAIIGDAYAAYTLDEANVNRDKVKSDITGRIKEYYKTDCIIEIAFGGLRFQ